MSSYNAVLQDKTGNQILPISKSENIWTSDSETLDTTLDRIASQGAGGAYVLPVATTTTLGGVKAGENVTIEVDGTISASSSDSYTLPVASGSTLGGIKLETYTTVPDTFNTDNCLTLIVEE